MTEPSPDTTDLSRRVLLSILEDEIRAGENLKKSEQRFRKFVETSPDGISVVGLDGLISFISPRILEIYGHSHESEIIGRSPIEWIAAEDRERARDNIGSILNGTPSRSNRYRLLKKDGTVFWGEINSSALSDEQGNPAGLIAIVRDVTQRMQTEEELRKAKEYSENLIRTANVMIVGLDISGAIVVFNNAAENISGYTLADLKGKNWFEVLVPKDRYPYVWDEFSRLTERGGVPKTYENPILTKGGEERVISWQNSTLSDGKVITGTISFGIDITERRKAEELVLENEIRYRSLFENSMDAVLLTSPDGSILEVNPATCRMFGQTAGEICSKGHNGLIDPGDPRLKDALKIREETGQVQAEITMVRGDGSRFFAEISSTVFTDARGQKRTSMIIRDLTERKRSEEQLRATEERFSRAFFSSPAGMSITRIADGTFIDVNDAFLRIFEFSREDTIGKRSTVLQMLTPGQQEELIRRQLETGGLNNEELITQARSGRVIHLLFSSRPIEVDGEPCHINTMIDITDRKKAEETARQQLEELQRWYEATLGREDRVRQLKHEVNQLLKRLGEPSRYASPEADQATPAAGSDAPV